LAPYVSELLDSDGLEKSRKTEEESELNSVLKKSMLNDQQCQESSSLTEGQTNLILYENKDFGFLDFQAEYNQ